MIRITHLAASAVVVLALTARSPAQDERGRTLEGSGKTVDPDADCLVTMEGSRLTIEIRGKLHEMKPKSKVRNAPRTGNECSPRQAHQGQ